MNTVALDQYLSNPRRDIKLLKSMQMSRRYALYSARICVYALILCYQSVEDRRSLSADIFRVAMLKLKQVDKSFRDRGDVIHVARDLSWCLGSGESAALMGAARTEKNTE